MKRSLARRPRSPVVGLLFALGWLLAPLPLSATEIVWLPDGKTTFFGDSANWIGGQLPDANDTVVFQAFDTYTVTFGQGATHAAAVVSRGDVTFNFAVAPPSANPLDDALQVTRTGTSPPVVSLLVSGTDPLSAPRLTITGGLVRTSSISVSGLPGLPGMLVVDGEGAELNATGSAVHTIVGSAGTGKLHVVNGGTVRSNTITIGTGTGIASGRGEGLISGAGSRWIGNALYLGSSSNSGNAASLIIEQGGYLRTSLLDNRALSNVLLTGHDTRWASEGGAVFRNGTFSVVDGGLFTGEAVDVGQSSVAGLSSHARMRVSGVDAEGNASRLTATTFSLGSSYEQRSARGLLTIEEGGQVSATHAVSLGWQSTPGIGVINVSGAGSRFDATGTAAGRGIYVGGNVTGAKGQGFLTVTSGGLLTAASSDGIRLYADGHLSGDATINSRVENRGTVAPSMRYTLAPAEPGGNTLFLSEMRGPASTLTIDGDYLQTADGLLDLKLGETSDRLVVTGGFTLGGLLRVGWFDGFSPLTGTSYDLFDFGSSAGTFESLDLPALDAGLAWDTTALYSSGIITVSAVPEPGASALLAGLGVLVLELRRRRQSQLVVE